MYEADLSVSVVSLLQTQWDNSETTFVKFCEVLGLNLYVKQ